MRAISLLFMIWWLSGCTGTSLGEVRATAPLQTGTFPSSYEQLAACAKDRIETDSWIFGQPIVQLTQDAFHQRASVYAMYSRSTLFDLTFQQALAARTLVEYRRSYDGHGSQGQVWAIIEQCAHQSPPSSPDAGTAR